MLLHAQHEAVGRGERRQRCGLGGIAADGHCEVAQLYALTQEAPVPLHCKGGRESVVMGAHPCEQPVVVDNQALHLHLLQCTIPASCHQERRFQQLHQTAARTWPHIRQALHSSPKQLLAAAAAVATPAVAAAPHLAEGIIKLGCRILRGVFVAGTA